MISRTRWLILLVLLTNGTLATAIVAAEPRFRRPVAVSLDEANNLLYVANRDTGSISVVNTKQRQVVDEVDVGRELSDIALIDQDRLVALDRKSHDLCLLTKGDSGWRVTARTNVAPDPVRLVLDERSSRMFVASLWSRTVSVLEWNHDLHSVPRLIGTAKLPFEPREMCSSPDGEHLIVACAFEARLAVLGVRPLGEVRETTLPGHNIGGMTISLDGRHLLVSQQELNPLAHTSRDDIHWGNLMSNLLVSLPIEDLLQQKPLVDHRVATEIGQPDAGAGDPGPLSIDDNGRVTVLLSGVHEVATTEAEQIHTFQRTAVGRRPVALATGSDGTTFVANMFSDSITVLPSEAGLDTYSISLGEQPDDDSVREGEALFFDCRLSHDGWLSCHSCHTDGHSNGQLVDNLSDGSFGTPKRTLSLHGVAKTSPWAWNGTVKSLDQQVRNSIERTMRGAHPSPERVQRLVAFMKTLTRPRSAIASPERNGLVERGMELFSSLGCARCHLPPTYTTAETYDVGLQDESGNRLFNPPPLIGAQSRRSFFHDGRALSLQGVVNKHKHQLDQELNEQDSEALVAFLKSL